MKSDGRFAIALFLTALTLGPAAAAADAPADRVCLACHARADMSSHGPKKVDLHIDADVLRQSAHASLTCVDCHAQMRSLPHKPLAVVTVECSRCHQSETVTYSRSVHGIARAQNDPDAPDCRGCHGSHAVRRIEQRETEFRKELVTLCLGCHTDERIVARHNLPRSSVIVAYQMSVHGDAVMRGSQKAPTCGDCHGSHGAGPLDGKASQEPFKIPELCGRCHRAELEEYRSSVHGLAVAGGDRESPTCTDCHGEHLIQARTEPSSTVARKNIPRTCSACHEALDIQTKHKLPQKRLETFETSFHGTLTRLGKTYAAECASCHGYHDIRPSTDPASRVNRANLRKTCGACHPADPAAFATLTVHAGLAMQVDATSTWQRWLEGPWIWLQTTVVFTVLMLLGALAWRRIAAPRR